MLKYLLAILLALPLTAFAQRTIYLYPELPVRAPDTTHGYGGLTLIERTHAPFLRVYTPPEGQPVRGALLILPGGGYSVIAIHYEGDDVAKWLASEGYLTMVLAYRLPKESPYESTSLPLPQLDVLQALKVSRKILAEYKSPVDKLVLVGFSAGGHLAATATVLADSLRRPDAAVLMYPVISLVAPHVHEGSRSALLGRDSARYADFSPELLATAAHPPTLFVHAMDDEVVLPANSIRYAERLRELGVPVALYLPERGRHGFALRRDLGWRGVLLSWLDRQGW